MNLCIDALTQAYPNGIRISNLNQPWMNGDNVNIKKIRGSLISDISGPNVAFLHCILDKMHELICIQKYIF
jgi:hypothetical protein